MIIYPEKIKKGDVIGITSTSGGMFNQTYLDRLNNAIKNVKGMDYKIKETSNAKSFSKKFVSSDCKIRAKEFLELWQDSEVKCIAQTFGGEFLMEILPFIDSKIMTKYQAKWTFGYSDSSLLNFFITTNYNIATITCDNIISFGMKPIHKSLFNTIKILETSDTIIQESYDLFEKDKLPREQRKFDGAYNLTGKVEYKNLYSNDKTVIKGRLIGGCIDVLTLLLGTPYDNTVNFCNQFQDGMLWYLENCELTLPALTRTLWQMKHSGWFNNANGFVLGRTRMDETIEDYEYLDVLHKIFDDMNVPVIYDADIGHVAPQWAMVNGSYATFEYKDGKGKITQEMI